MGKPLNYSTMTNSIDKFNIADYLDDKQMMIEYITTVIQEGDDKDLVVALEHIVEAINKKSPDMPTGTS